MNQQAEPQLRPFHETIIGAIERCSPPGYGEIFHLHQLIMETEIPENHDAILETLRRYWDFIGSDKYGREIREVAESLRDQKRRCEAKT